MVSFHENVTSWLVLSAWVRPSDLEIWANYIYSISAISISLISTPATKIYSQKHKKTSHSEMRETFQLIFVSPSQWLLGRVNILTFPTLSHTIFCGCNWWGKLIITLNKNISYIIKPDPACHSPPFSQPNVPGPLSCNPTKLYPLISILRLFSETRWKGADGVVPNTCDIPLCWWLVHSN